MSETAEEREKRVVKLLAGAMKEALPITFSNRSPKADASELIGFIRAAGGDVTVPDLPEPTYEFSGLTQQERDCIIQSLDSSWHSPNLMFDFRERCGIVLEKLRRVKPDSVTS